MKGIIKIKSISDVITNSSSEVFVLQNKSDITEKVKKRILNYHSSHQWYHCDFDNLPSDIIAMMGGEENLKKVDDMLNESSGMGGDIEVITWEDAYDAYFQTQPKDKISTPEQWAKDLNFNLDEAKRIIIVDLDWASKATIRMLKEKFNVIVEGEDSYDNKWYSIFRYASKWNNYEL